MARIDLLLTKPSKQAPIRIGDIRKKAPYVLIKVEGQDAILPMPTNVSSGNQILWEQKDFTAGSALGSAALAQGIDIANVDLSAIASSGKSMLDQLGSIGTATTAGVVGALAGVADAKDLYYHKAGKAVNPNKEMTFNGVGYRSFTFEFELIPLSSNEANEIRNFIEFFQEHAMPDYANQDKTYFAYPGAWDIQWVNCGSWMPKMMPVQLTDYAVNYGGVGKMVQHEGGAPVQTNISLTFVENEIHMKDKIRQGYTG